MVVKLKNGEDWFERSSAKQETHKSDYLRSEHPTDLLQRHGDGFLQADRESVLAATTAGQGKQPPWGYCER